MTCQALFSEFCMWFPSLLKNSSSKAHQNCFTGEMTKAEDIRVDLKRSQGKQFVDPKRYQLVQFQLIAISCQKITMYWLTLYLVKCTNVKAVSTNGVHCFLVALGHKYVTELLQASVFFLYNGNEETGLMS